MPLENKLTAQFYVHDDEKWEDVQLTIKAGKLRIHLPYSDMSIYAIGSKTKYLSLKNWFRASLSKPLLCQSENFEVRTEDMTININIGFPFDEPIVLKTDLKNKEELFVIKELWQGKYTDQPTSTKIVGVS